MRSAITKGRNNGPSMERGCADRVPLGLCIQYVISQNFSDTALAQLKSPKSSFQFFPSSETPVINTVPLFLDKPFRGPTLSWKKQPNSTYI